VFHGPDQRLLMNGAWSVGHIPVNAVKRLIDPATRRLVEPGERSNGAGDECAEHPQIQDQNAR